MTDDIPKKVVGETSNEWSSYNNFGICAVAIMSILSHAYRLSLPRALLVMPLVMHESTVKFLGNGNVRQRQVAALVAARADLFANFRQRYESSLVVTLNTIQALIELGYIEFDKDIRMLRPLELNEKFGSRTLKIEKASANISALLASSEEDLYLNLRVWL